MLWLALRFPLLPLEALPLRQSPSAVVAGGRVVACDPAAAGAGVAAGQKLSTALGLQPGLAVFERDAGREGRALDDLACWAARFTPTVSLRPPALLLEIGGCLRLFGGTERIVEAVRQGCGAQGWSVTWAVAPTPLGATWLAGAGDNGLAVDPAGMPAALAALPVDAAGWPVDVEKRLAAFGLRTLGELRRLPGASLRQRLGNGPVDDLLRAWGELPDLPPAFVFPEKFSIRIELPARVEHAEALAFSGVRLFAALAGWLQVRQLLVRACTLTLSHDDAPDSLLSLRFAEPAADEGRFVRLLRERLARLQLSAPVEAVALRADEVVVRADESRHLFDRPSAGEGAQACLERVQARLGEAAVQLLSAPADHRPECAVRTRQAGGMVAGTTSATPGGQRPLWLLPVPQALAERSGQPHWRGPLKLFSRAERLESGWWDEDEAGTTGDVRRDYFVACNPPGQWVWIFRDAEGWFLHGLFA